MSVPGGGSWQAGQGAGQFTPGQATAMPTSTVELSLQCANLADMDVFSKSDPFCVLYMKVRLLRTSFWEGSDKLFIVRSRLVAPTGGYVSTKLRLLITL